MPSFSGLTFLTRFALADAFYHLLVGYSELSARIEQGYHDTQLGMRVNDRASLSHSVGVHKKRRALALFEFLDRRRLGHCFPVQFLNKQVVWFHALLVNTRRSNVDLVSESTSDKSRTFTSTKLASSYPFLIVIPPPVPVTFQISVKIISRESFLTYSSPNLPNLIGRTAAIVPESTSADAPKIKINRRNLILNKPA